MADSQAKIAQKTWELSNNIMEVSFLAPLGAQDMLSFVR